MQTPTPDQLREFFRSDIFQAEKVFEENYDLAVEEFYKRFDQIDIIQEDVSPVNPTDEHYWAIANESIEKMEKNLLDNAKAFLDYINRDKYTLTIGQLISAQLNGSLTISPEFLIANDIKTL